MNARRGTHARAPLSALSPRAQRRLVLALLVVNVAALVALGSNAPGEHVAALGATVVALLLAALP